MSYSEITPLDVLFSFCIVMDELLLQRAAFTMRLWNFLLLESTSVCFFSELLRISLVVSVAEYTSIIVWRVRNAFLHSVHPNT